jgi:uncharacterized protein YbjT (DUF2867 family)
MSGRTATIIGATGLIGSHLLELAQTDNYYQKVRILVRRPVDVRSSKIEAKLVDFSDYDSFKVDIYNSDVVFCAVGTTLSKVKGDKAAYRKIDYDIPVRAAKLCKETGCEKFILVSSVGANSKSKNFYLQLKGEVEDAVKNSEIQSISIFRPSILLGDRKEKRLGESIGKVGMQFFSFAMIGNLEKYKPVHAREVAAAMINASKKRLTRFNVYEYRDIKELASTNNHVS